MKFRLGDIQPNPHRRLNRYPLRPDKIDALRESIRTTKFWENIVVRIREDGLPELAYGHHRLEAMLLEFGPEHEVFLPVGEIDDETMVQMMVRDNSEKWDFSASIAQEWVRGAVEAYAAGIIELAKPKGGDSQHRYAPSFQIGKTSGSNLKSPYSVGTLADFVKLDRTKVEDTLHALELIEKDILSEKDYGELLTTTQARVLTNEVRKFMKRGETLARAYEKDALRAEKQRDNSIDEESRARAESLRIAALKRAERTRKKFAEDARYLAEFIRENLKDGTWSTGQISKKIPKRFKPATLRTRGPRTARPRDPNHNDPKEVNQYLENLDLFSSAIQEAEGITGKFSFEALVLTTSQQKRIRESLLKIEKDFEHQLLRWRSRGGLLEYIK